MAMQYIQRDFFNEWIEFEVDGKRHIADLKSVQDDKRTCTGNFEFEGESYEFRDTVGGEKTITSIKQITLLNNAIKFMKETYFNATTTEMLKAAEEYADRIKSQLIDEGFTPGMAELARLEAKFGGLNAQ